MGGFLHSKKQRILPKYDEDKIDIIESEKMMYKHRTKINNII